MKERQVQFLNKGQRMFGILHCPEEGRGPGILFFHGFTGDKVGGHRILVKTARELAKRGFYALRFDFRGSGDSEGDFKDVTVGEEISDGLVALDFLANQEGVDQKRLGIIGLSLGGTVAACVAGEDRRVKSIALWSAMADFHVLAQLSTEEQRKEMLEKGEMDLGGLTLGKGFVEELPMIKPLERVKDFLGSALIIHGENDVIVPLRHAEMFYEALSSNSPCELHIVKKADHVFSSRGWEAEVIEKTVKWFASNLAVRGSRSER